MLITPQTDRSLDPGAVTGIPAETAEVRNAEEERVLSPTMAFESVSHELRRTGQLAARPARLMRVSPPRDYGRGIPSDVGPTAVAPSSSGQYARIPVGQDAVTQVLAEAVRHGLSPAAFPSGVNASLIMDEVSRNASLSNQARNLPAPPQEAPSTCHTDDPSVSLWPESYAQEMRGRKPFLCSDCKYPPCVGCGKDRPRTGAYTATRLPTFRCKDCR